MSRAAVSNLAKTLVADGMMVRTPGERDGRSVILSLTEDGRRRMLDIFAGQHERERQWAGVLTETEQRMLIMLLDKLIEGRHRFDVRERS
jgi:DNA-binding MarR family transcriptional regulator